MVFFFLDHAKDLRVCVHYNGKLAIISCHTTPIAVEMADACPTVHFDFRYHYLKFVSSYKIREKIL